MKATQHLTIRHAGLEDLEALTAIEESSFTLPWPAEVISRDLTGEHGACYWVAKVDDEIVAYVGAWLVGPDLHIGSLATAPSHRRRGLGKLLMLCALRQAAARGAEQAFLEHRASNRPAARLYAQLGFEKLRVRRAYYADNQEDAVEMRLSGLQSQPVRLRLLQDLDFWLRDHNYDVELTDLECE